MGKCQHAVGLKFICFGFYERHISSELVEPLNFQRFHYNLFFVSSHASRNIGSKNKIVKVSEAQSRYISYYEDP
jgi:hypothetical protein